MVECDLRIAPVMKMHQAQQRRVHIARDKNLVMRDSSCKAGAHHETKLTPVRVTQRLDCVDITWLCCSNPCAHR